MMFARLAVIAAACALGGCAAVTLAGDGGPESTRETPNFYLPFPAGWFIYPPFSEHGGVDSVKVTRDGDAVQQWSLDWVRWNAPLFSRSHRLRKGVPQADIARMLVAARAHEEHYAWYDIVALEPTTISGHDAFRIEFRHRRIGGPAYRTVLYGLPLRRGVYVMSFNAIEIYFFEKDIAAFETFVSEVRVKPQR